MKDLPDPSDRLDSWKEIASFLGRTVRTVQRWEKHEGLPVRRGGPARRGSVIGSKREIGEWWHRRGSTLSDADDVETADAPPERTSRGLLWLLFIGIGAAVAAVVTFVVLS